MKQITETKSIIIISVVFMFIVVACKEKASIPPQKPVSAAAYRIAVPPAVDISNTNKTEEKGIDKTEEKAVEIIEKEMPIRNPFKPIVLQKVLSKVQAKTQIAESSKKVIKPEQPIEPKTPLQKYETGQLKLAAIIWGAEDSAAMVEAPDGKGYTIRVGDLIGNRGGQVSKILGNKVVIEERHKDDSGAVRKKELSLTMPAGEGEGLR